MENYTIYDEIGRGTHSFVYKARRKRSIEYVAVKSTAKTRMEKILNEVQLLHKLDSRHVLKFYNWYESQNHIWLIFEYCIGGDLLNLITQDRRLPEPAVKAFGWELVSGLRFLHVNSILYCDLKPANVLIDECGSLKLADFGLARRIPTVESMAAPQLASGSPNYMAPELFQPAAIHSFASDFWALGCVLYELCTGRPPFTHTFFPELARIIQNEPLVIPREGYAISPSFADLLQKLLEKDPYRRITWDELLAHPFWSGCEPLEEASLPAQELFDAARPDTDTRELHTESHSIAIHDHDDSAARCEALSLGGRESTATETTSDESTLSHHHSDHDELGIEKPSSKHDDDDDDSVSESESDRQDELADEIVGIRAVRPITAPAVLNREPKASKRHYEETKPAQPHGDLQPIPRVRTAPLSGIETKHDQLIHPQPNASSRRSSLVRASRLLFVAADATVKPIAFCGDIEYIEIPCVRTDELEFEAISPENLVACSGEDLEYHLKSIYISLKSAEQTATEKTNVLAHLFALSLMPKLANVILNSSLLTLLVKMLRHSHATPASPNGLSDQNLSSMIMLVLGVLFRLGTFISTPSPEHIQNLVGSLSFFLSAPSAKSEDNSKQLDPKRLAAACLGELLFHLACQPRGSLIPVGAVALVRAMEDTDSVTKHYAIRAVTNILARSADDNDQGGLVQEQTVLALVRCLVSLPAVTGDDSLLLKTSTIQALAQLFRRLRLPAAGSTNSSTARTRLCLMAAVSQTSLLASLWRGAASGHRSPELAIASLNVLNSYLEMSISNTTDDEPYLSISKHKQVLLEKQVEMTELTRLLDIRPRYEEDGENTHTQDVGQRHQQPKPSANESRRRYAQDDRAAPMLLRAKAILLIHFGMVHSLAFARQCVRVQIIDKIEASLSPFGAILRAQHLPSPAKDSAASPSGRMASARQLTVLDQYFLQCGQHVVRVCIRTALKLSAECISSSQAIAYEEEDGELGEEGHTGQPFTPLIASEPFQMLEQLIKNPTCCTQLCSYFLANNGKEFRYFLRLMSKLLTSFASETLAAMASTVGAVISRLLLRLFQSSSLDAVALVAAEPVVLFTHLLPAVVVQLLYPQNKEPDGEDDDDDEHDHSVRCMQLVYLIMLHIDYELDAMATRERGHFVHEHLLPCFRMLIGSTVRQNENVWRFAQELLHGLVSREPEAMVATLVTQGFVGPILALLSSPTLLNYHSLPLSATALVKSVVEVHKKANTMESLYTHHIARHVHTGLEYVVHSSTYNAGTVNLLDVLYMLLFHRYEERRKTDDANSPAPLEFEKLVECGPLLLQICAQSDASLMEDEEPQDSPRAENHSAIVQLEVLDAGSRCLIFLSQIFGARLNEILFGSSSSKACKEEATRSLVLCLQSHHDRMLHHVLLTIKNALRWDKKSGTSWARRWLQNDKAAMAEIVRITNRSSPTKNPRATSEQVVKTASEIVAHLQTTR